MKKFLNLLRFSNFIPYLLFSLVAFLVVLSCKCAPWNCIPHIDSSVYIYVARVIENGGAVYTDVFDHKGPLLYLLNYLGLKIAGVNGIGYLECSLWILFVGQLFLFLMKSMGKFVASLFIIIMCPLFIRGWCGGNMNESWAVYFISLIIYVFLNFYNNHKFSRFDYIVVGLSSAGIVMIKPNMVMTGVVFCSFVLIEFIKKQKWHELFRSIIYIFSGVLILMLPILIWLYNSGCLADCWECYINYNLKYVNSYKIGVIHNWTYLYGILIAVLFAGYWFVKDKKQQYLWLLITLIAGFCVILKKPIFHHYFLVLSVPASVLSAMLCKRLFSLKIIGKISVGLVSIICVVMAVRTVVNGFPMSQHDKNSRLETLKFSSKICDVNSVTVMGNDCWLYEVLGVRTPWRYPYQPSLLENMHEIIMDEIKKGSSRYLILNKKYKEIKKEILPYYKMIDETKTYCLYEIIK